MYGYNTYMYHYGPELMRIKPNPHVHVHVHVYSSCSASLALCSLQHIVFWPLSLRVSTGNCYKSLLLTRQIQELHHFVYMYMINSLSKK